MATAIASLLTHRPVKHTVGMTGEITLQGRVLPIGGLKQKVLAAHAAGITDVIMPERNRADLEDIPENVREDVTFHPVMSIDEVLSLALSSSAATPSRSCTRRCRAARASPSSGRRSARYPRARSPSGSRSSRRPVC
jgi:ATP-dependent Lon protease